MIFAPRQALLHPFSTISGVYPPQWWLELGAIWQLPGLECRRKHKLSGALQEQTRKACNHRDMTVRELANLLEATASQVSRVLGEHKVTACHLDRKSIVVASCRLDGLGM